jgi:hypothetical protein
MSSPAQPAPDSLFLDEERRALYTSDVYFRETWAMLAKRWEDPCSQLWPLAGIVLKPDGVVTRSGPKALRILREEGFVPAAFQRFRFDRHIMRTSWRFHVPVPDLDRLRIVDRLMTATDSLFVLVRDSVGEGVPGTIRLTKLKGGALKEGRDKRHLRERLGVEHSLMTLVHAIDEPADLVRDLGVYFTIPQRIDILEQLEGDGIEEALDRTLEDLHRETPRHDLNFDRSLERLRIAISEADSGDGRRAEALALWDSMAAGETYDWPRLAELGGAIGALFDPWDLTTVGAVLTARLVPSEARISPQDTVKAWEQAAQKGLSPIPRPRQTPAA